jgi:hypothetical protein
MRRHLRRFAATGFAAALLATSGCAVRGSGPSPGVGDEPVPARTADERRRVGKAWIIVGVVALAILVLTLTATNGDDD